MAYLGKNINMALLLLIVGIVVVLIGITIVFQTGLKTRTSDYELASENLTECSTQLANYKDRLSEEEEKATSAAQDIRRYDQLYEGKVDELSEAADELDASQKKVTLKDLRITSLESEKNILKDKEDQCIQNLNTKIGEIERLDDKIDSYQSKISCCKDEADLTTCISECFD